jgi:chemotaxis protein methyltransferase CheR
MSNEYTGTGTVHRNLNLRLDVNESTAVVAPGAAITEPPELRPQEFDQIRLLAQRTSGIDLQPGKEELVSARLRRLVRAGGFRSYREYYEAVVADRTGKSLARMIDALTTNHTSFLREPDHFDFLRLHVFPQWSGRRHIEIWSAGCATGEEAWTLAFLANDAFSGRVVRITATDISTRAIECAARGTYPAGRCDELPTEWLLRYFNAEPSGTYRVMPSVRAQVSFERLNLVEPFPLRRPFPLIFCRNVMIYFDRSTQERVVQALAECLEPGGYLFVGHSEGLTRIRHQLEYIGPAVYRKPDSRGQVCSRR